MRRTLVACLTLAVAAGFASFGRAEDPAPADGPGWTGLTNPEDVILARQALMTEMERLMQPIDSLTAGEPADPDELRSAATTIAQVLLALPHLFPPTTNRYDPAAATPVTIAMPAIWQDFPTFRALADAASAAATTLASATDADALAAGSQRLRAACDACHAPFLRPYVPSTVTDEDREFDFDALFETDAGAESTERTPDGR
jgi:cytochrome c556